MPEMLTDDEVRDNVAANVTDLLEEKGWTQTELAERTGDPIATISAICRGRSVPGSGILSRMADAFRVNLDKLVGPPPVSSSRKAS